MMNPKQLYLNLISQSRIRAANDGFPKRKLMMSRDLGIDISGKSSKVKRKRID
jgi:hypothetical protein